MARTAAGEDYQTFAPDNHPMSPGPPADLRPSIDRFGAQIAPTASYEVGRLRSEHETGRAGLARSIVADKAGLPAARAGVDQALALLEERRTAVAELGELPADADEWTVRDRGDVRRALADAETGVELTKVSLAALKRSISDQQARLAAMPHSAQIPPDLAARAAAEQRAAEAAEESSEARRSRRRARREG